MWRLLSRLLPRSIARGIAQTGDFVSDARWAAEQAVASSSPQLTPLLELLPIFTMWLADAGYVANPLRPGAIRSDWGAWITSSDPFRNTRMALYTWESRHGKH